jgi:type IV secretory pathway VirB10-like protein
MPVPPPLGLPPPQRQVRALRRTPLFIASGISVAVVGIIYYGITHMGHGSSAGAPQATDTSASGDATDVLQGAPAGVVINAARPPRAAFIPAAAAAPVQFHFNDPQPAPAPAPASSPASNPPGQPDDDMTDEAIAARKAAWDSYYKALTDQRETHLKARQVAMGSDMEATAPIAQPATITSTPGTNNGTLGGNGDKDKPTDFFAANASSPATDYSPYTVTDPLSPYELKATDTITAKLVSSVNSDSPGIIKAIVTKTVTDHATGMNILIPQGSTLVGVYNTSVGYGQTRLVTAWTRIIYPAPCDQSLDLGAMAGSDQSGQAGFEDLTDNHLFKIFGSALLVSVFAAGIQLSQPPQSAISTYSPVQSAGGAVGQQMGQLGQAFAQKGLNIPPTERIRQGYDFTVMISKDIAFQKPWVDGQCAPMDVEVASR